LRNTDGDCHKITVVDQVCKLEQTYICYLN